MRWRECVDPGLMPRAGTDTLTTPPARPGVTCASPQDGAVGPGASGDTLTGKERSLRHAQRARRSDRPLSPPDFGRDFPDPEGMSPDKAQPLLPVLLASELPRPRPRRPASTKRRNPPLSHFEVFELPPFDPSSTPGQAAFLATHADTENVDLNVCQYHLPGLSPSSPLWPVPPSLRERWNRKPVKNVLTGSCP